MNKVAAALAAPMPPLIRLKPKPLWTVLNVGLTAFAGSVLQSGPSQPMPAMKPFFLSKRLILPPGAALGPETAVFRLETAPPLGAGAALDAPGAEFRPAGAALAVAGAEFRRAGASLPGTGAEFRRPGASLAVAGAEFRQPGAAPIFRSEAPVERSGAPMTRSGHPASRGVGPQPSTTNKEPRTTPT